jgi:hypothetical protein
LPDCQIEKNNPTFRGFLALSHGLVSKESFVLISSDHPGHQSAFADERVAGLPKQNSRNELSLCCILNAWMYDKVLIERIEAVCSNMQAARPGNPEKRPLPYL